MADKKISAILIGAGGRGRVYTDDMAKYPDLYEVVAVAEPIDARREYIAEKHNIPADRVFRDWRELMALPKIADACIICTMDQDHTIPTMLAIDKGYEILLEKPAAATPEDCMLLANYAEQKGVEVLVCHVLRYTPFFMTLKNLIDDGYVGKVMQIRHTEDVGHIHQSHSFVRGNWGNSERSTPMILQKCCHDLDIIQWLIGTPCTRIQSFGSLSHFNKANCPEGAPLRCTDGCPAADTCYYNAEKVYLSETTPGWFKNAASKMHEPTDEAMRVAVKDGDYGRCVFRCDNDVVDHQVVNMEFEGGTLCTMTMSAFNQGGRRIRIYGTKGEVSAAADATKIDVFEFDTREWHQINIEDAIASDSITSGHGGGDSGIMVSFYDMLSGKECAELSDISISVKNHMIVFAAEKSRLEGRVVEVSELDYDKIMK
jgi:predicted dehydrogenase